MINKYPHDGKWVATDDEESGKFDDESSFESKEDAIEYARESYYRVVGRAVAITATSIATERLLDRVADWLDEECSDQMDCMRGDKLLAIPEDKEGRELCRIALLSLVERMLVPTYWIRDTCEITDSEGNDDAA